MNMNLTEEQIRTIKEDIDRRLPVRVIVAKYHISFNVYAQIKNTAIDQLTQKRNNDRPALPDKFNEQNNEDDLGDLLIMKELNMITENELNWVVERFNKMKNEGSVKTINELLNVILTDGEKRTIEQYKKGEKANE